MESELKSEIASESVTDEAMSLVGEYHVNDPRMETMTDGSKDTTDLSFGESYTIRDITAASHPLDSRGSADSHFNAQSEFVKQNSVKELNPRDDVKHIDRDGSAISDASTNICSSPELTGEATGYAQSLTVGNCDFFQHNFQPPQGEPNTFQQSLAFVPPEECDPKFRQDFCDFVAATLHKIIDSIERHRKELNRVRCQFGGEEIEVNLKPTTTLNACLQGASKNNSNVSKGSLIEVTTKENHGEMSSAPDSLISDPHLETEMMISSPTEESSNQCISPHNLRQSNQRIPEDSKDPHGLGSERLDDMQEPFQRQRDESPETPALSSAEFQIMGLRRETREEPGEWQIQSKPITKPHIDSDNYISETESNFEQEGRLTSDDSTNPSGLNVSTGSSEVETTGSPHGFQASCEILAVAGSSFNKKRNAANLGIQEQTAPEDDESLTKRDEDYPSGKPAKSPRLNTKSVILDSAVSQVVYSDDVCALSSAEVVFQRNDRQAEDRVPSPQVALLNYDKEIWYKSSTGSFQFIDEEDNIIRQTDPQAEPSLPSINNVHSETTLEEPTPQSIYEALAPTSGPCLSAESEEQLERKAAPVIPDNPSLESSRKGLLSREASCLTLLRLKENTEYSRQESFTCYSDKSLKPLNFLDYDSAANLADIWGKEVTKKYDTSINPVHVPLPETEEINEVPETDNPLTNPESLLLDPEKELANILLGEEELLQDPFFMSDSYKPGYYLTDKPFNNEYDDNEIFQCIIAVSEKICRITEGVQNALAAQLEEEMKSSIYTETPQDTENSMQETFHAGLVSVTTNTDVIPNQDFYLNEVGRSASAGKVASDQFVENPCTEKNVQNVGEELGEISQDVYQLCKISQDMYQILSDQGSFTVKDDKDIGPAKPDEDFLREQTGQDLTPAKLNEGSSPLVNDQEVVSTEIDQNLLSVLTDEYLEIFGHDMKLPKFSQQVCSDKIESNSVHVETRVKSLSLEKSIKLNEDKNQLISKFHQKDDSSLNSEGAKSVGPSSSTTMSQSKEEDQVKEPQRKKKKKSFLKAALHIFMKPFKSPRH